MAIAKIIGKWANVKIFNPSVENETEVEVELKKENSNELSNEKVAAITMALHLYLNAYRDEESEVITIDMPSAHYSPWAQKHLVMKRVARRF